MAVHEDRAGEQRQERKGGHSRGSGEKVTKKKWKRE